MRSTLVLSLGVLLAWPCLGAAQGIGDAAARERQKRAASGKKEPARVVTDADLNEGRPPGETSKAASSAAPSEGRRSSDVPPSTVSDASAHLAPHRDAVNRAQAQVEQIEARVRTLSAKINPMSTSFIYGATGSNSANEEAEVRSALGQAEGELAEARKALNAANEALSKASRGGSDTPSPD